MLASWTSLSCRRAPVLATPGAASSRETGKDITRERAGAFYLTATNPGTWPA